MLTVSQYELDALILKLDALPNAQKLDKQTIEIAKRILVNHEKAKDLALIYGLSPARIYNIRKRMIVAHLKTYVAPSQTPAEFVAANNDILTNLDGRNMPNGGKVGRPIEMMDGKKFTVYLDLESLAVAVKLGDGNISNGIRQALKHAAKTAQKAATQT
jgi:ribonucleotide monophosphatase NagD (HAD superfamily)